MHDGQVFDVDRYFKSMDDFQEYFAEIGRVNHTPAVGLWEDGIPKLSASGGRARDWLIERYSLFWDPREIWPDAYK